MERRFQVELCIPRKCYIPFLGSLKTAGSLGPKEAEKSMLEHWNDRHHSQEEINELTEFNKVALVT